MMARQPEREVMTAKTFKVGDRVKSVATTEHGGYEGTVERIEDHGTVDVAFDGWTGGHSGYSDDHSAINHFYFFYDSGSKNDGFSGLRILKPKAPAKPSQAYKGNGKHEWEIVTPTQYLKGGAVVLYPLYRLRVPGGWLYAREGGEATFVPLPEVVKHAV